MHQLLQQHCPPHQLELPVMMMMMVVVVVVCLWLWLLLFLLFTLFICVVLLQQLLHYHGHFCPSRP